MKRPLLGTFLSIVTIIAAIILFFEKSIIAAIFLIILFALEMLYLIKKSKGTSKYWFLGIILIITVRAAFYAYFFDNSYKLASNNLKNVTIYGSVEKIQMKEAFATLQIKNCNLIQNNSKKPVSGILIQLKLDNEVKYIPKEGQVIRIEGDLEPVEKPMNDGEFDEYTYYKSKEISGKIVNPSISLVRKQSILAHLRLEYRQRGIDFFNQILDEEEAGIIRAMVLGDKCGLTDSVKENFKKANMSHVLAVSGLHMAVVGMGAYSLFRRKKMKRSFAGLLAGMMVIAFSFSTGTENSTMRAVIMFLIMILGNVLGEDYDLSTSMSISGIIILLIAPFSIIDTGFQYSFMSILAISMAEEVLRIKYLEVGGLIKAVIYGITIMLMLLPISLYYDYGFSTFGFLINIIVIPLLSPILILGFLSLGISFFSIKIAGIILKPAELIIDLFMIIAKGYKHIPIGYIYLGRPNFVIIIAYYLTIFIIFYYSRKEIKLSFLAPLGIIFLIIPRFLYTNNTTFLYVGQGDGIYIESRDGYSFMVDGGSSSKPNVGSKTILSYLHYHGRNSIDYWFISHPDNDHISGLIELIEGDFKVKNIVISGLSAELNSERYQRIIEDSRKNNIKIILFGDGDSISSKEVSFTCISVFSEQKLYDATRENREVASDINEMSMILKVNFTKSNKNLLLCGDISSKVEELLAIRLESEKTKIDYFKANHHGSKYSNSDTFMQKIKPEVIVISCGKYNRYHFPSKEAYERMERTGAVIFDTSKCGQVRIKFD